MQQIYFKYEYGTPVFNITFVFQQRQKKQNRFFLNYFLKYVKYYHLFSQFEIESNFTDKPNEQVHQFHQRVTFLW